MSWQFIFLTLMDVLFGILYKRDHFRRNWRLIGDFFIHCVIFELKHIFLGPRLVQTPIALPGNIVHDNEPLNFLTSFWLKPLKLAFALSIFWMTSEYNRLIFARITHASEIESPTVFDYSKLIIPVQNLQLFEISVSLVHSCLSLH